MFSLLFFWGNVRRNFREQIERDIEATREKKKYNLVVNLFEWFGNIYRWCNHLPRFGLKTTKKRTKLKPFEQKYLDAVDPKTVFITRAHTRIGTPNKEVFIFSSLFFSVSFSFVRSLARSLIFFFLLCLWYWPFCVGIFHIGLNSNFLPSALQTCAIFLDST